MIQPCSARSLALAVVVASFAACAPARPASDAGSLPAGDRAATDAAARAAIVATSREFSARYERGDTPGMVALYTPDGVILPPGRDASSGPAALAAYWTRAPGVRVLEHRATPDSIVVVGPVAYDWGRYFVRTQDSTGTSRETHGKYVIVWRESPPGTWRMHVDMWNAAPRPGQ